MLGKISIKNVFIVLLFHKNRWFHAGTLRGNQIKTFRVFFLFLRYTCRVVLTLFIPAFFIHQELHKSSICSESTGRHAEDKAPNFSSFNGINYQILVFFFSGCVGPISTINKGFLFASSSLPYSISPIAS